MGHKFVKDKSRPSGIPSFPIDGYIESFYLLLSFVHDALQVDKAKVASHGGMIIPELCLYCTLCYLAGASYLDVIVFASIST